MINFLNLKMALANKDRDLDDKQIKEKRNEDESEVDDEQNKEE